MWFRLAIIVVLVLIAVYLYYSQPAEQLTVATNNDTLERVRDTKEQLERAIKGLRESSTNHVSAYAAHHEQKIRSLEKELSGLVTHGNPRGSPGQSGKFATDGTNMVFSMQDGGASGSLPETTYRSLLHSMDVRARAINSVGIPVLESYADKPAHNYLSQSLMLYGAEGSYSDVDLRAAEEYPYSKTFGSVESYLNFEPDHVVLTG